MPDIAKRIVRSALGSFGFSISRLPNYRRIYEKYRAYTMCSRATFEANLALAASVRSTGCVIECGVWKGGSSAGMAEVLGPDRDYFLFDGFQGMPPPQPIDGPAAAAWEADKDGPWYFDNGCVGPEEAERAMRLSGARRFKVIEGWFEDTLPGFVPPSPIAVLRIDCDWHQPTLTCLRALYPYVDEAGIVIVDDYHAWDGSARAVHEYLAEAEEVARIREFHGVTYLVKGAQVWRA